MLLKKAKYRTFILLLKFDYDNIILQNSGELIMKKKIIIAVIMIAVLIAAIAAVIVIKNKTVSNDTIKSYDTIEEANEAADFTLEASDRLCGVPATDYKSDRTTVEVYYGNAGYIRKTTNEANSGKSDYPEVNEQNFNGREVTLKGEDGKIFIAEWDENNFAYTISLNEGVEADEMADYIDATR